MLSLKAVEKIYKNKKIYIIPVTFNYQFVLEGPALINQYLSKNKFNNDLGYSNSFKIFTSYNEALINKKFESLLI